MSECGKGDSTAGHACWRTVRIALIFNLPFTLAPLPFAMANAVYARVISPVSLFFPCLFVVRSPLLAFWFATTILPLHSLTRSHSFSLFPANAFAPFSTHFFSLSVSETALVRPLPLRCSSTLAAADVFILLDLGHTFSLRIRESVVPVRKCQPAAERREGSLREHTELAARNTMNKTNKRNKNN